MLAEYPPLVNKVLCTETDELTAEEIVQSIREMDSWLAARHAEAIERHEADFGQYDDMADARFAQLTGMPMF